jgi:hypothetical protein
MNSAKEFFNVMKEKGFDISDVSENFFARISVIPRHRKTPEGHHNIINNITVVNFAGSDTKDGDLGCVVFSYNGTERRKSHRVKYYYQELDIIKKSFCPKSAKEAIEAYSDFVATSQKTMNSWELIA